MIFKSYTPGTGIWVHLRGTPFPVQGTICMRLRIQLYAYSIQFNNCNPNTNSSTRYPGGTVCIHNRSSLPTERVPHHDSAGFLARSVPLLSPPLESTSVFVFHSVGFVYCVGFGFLLLCGPCRNSTLPLAPQEFCHPKTLQTIDSCCVAGLLSRTSSYFRFSISS